MMTREKFNYIVDLLISVFVTLCGLHQFDIEGHYLTGLLLTVGGIVYLLSIGENRQNASNLRNCDK